MLPECQSADVHRAGSTVAVVPAACCAYSGPLDPCAGWYLVQRDWGVRQDEPATARSGPLARIFALWPRLRARLAPRRRSFASASR